MAAGCSNRLRKLDLANTTVLRLGLYVSNRWRGAGRRLWQSFLDIRLSIVGRKVLGIAMSCHEVDPGKRDLLRLILVVPA